MVIVKNTMSNSFHLLSAHCVPDIGISTRHAEKSLFFQSIPGQDRGADTQWITYHWAQCNLRNTEIGPLAHQGTQVRDAFLEGLISEPSLPQVQKKAWWDEHGLWVAREDEEKWLKLRLQQRLGQEKVFWSLPLLFLSGLTWRQLHSLQPAAILSYTRPVHVLSLSLSFSLYLISRQKRVIASFASLFPHHSMPSSGNICRHLSKSVLFLGKASQPLSSMPASTVSLERG